MRRHANLLNSAPDKSQRSRLRRRLRFPRSRRACGKKRIGGCSVHRHPVKARSVGARSLFPTRRVIPQPITPSTIAPSIGVGLINFGRLVRISRNPYNMVRATGASRRHRLTARVYRSRSVCFKCSLICAGARPGRVFGSNAVPCRGGTLQSDARIALGADAGP